MCAECSAAAVSPGRLLTPACGREGRSREWRQDQSAGTERGGENTERERERAQPLRVHRGSGYEPFPNEYSRLYRVAAKHPWREKSKRPKTGSGLLSRRKRRKKIKSRKVTTPPLCSDAMRTTGEPGGAGEADASWCCLSACHPRLKTEIRTDGMTIPRRVTSDGHDDPFLTPPNII